MPTLEWLTRDQDLTASSRVPYRLLEAVPDLSYGDPATENMIIQGDNLDALKALLPVYAGQVKCIFIDPPYNTRSAFEHYDDNLEHSQWLSLMYPRLELLRDLLREDGSIWVTIDDNEAHYLKVIMDEVFGRNNFVANVIWQKKYAKQNDAKWLSVSHDHILLYARNRDAWHPNHLPKTAEQVKNYKNPDNDPRGPWQSVVYTCAKSRKERPNLYYPITHPGTGAQIYPKETRVWGYDPEKHAQHVREKRMWWGAKDEKEKPRLKFFLSEVGSSIVPDTLWLRNEFGDNQDAKREAMAFASGELFTTPKPERLIKQLCTIATNPRDFVLDSFLGSGTTAAVAQKMDRRYIGIEMGEHAVTHCVPRLKKVIDGEQGGVSEAVGWQGGGGFRFLRLGPPIFDEDGNINPKISFVHLAAHIWFTETRTPLIKPRRNPKLGVHDGTALYLLYNGILHDRRPEGGNVLTRAVLDSLNHHDGPRIIYGESSRLAPATLKRLNVTFKQTPYDVRAR